MEFPHVVHVSCKCLPYQIFVLPSEQETSQGLPGKRDNGCKFAARCRCHEWLATPMRFNFQTKRIWGSKDLCLLSVSTSFSTSLSYQSSTPKEGERFVSSQRGWANAHIGKNGLLRFWEQNFWKKEDNHSLQAIHRQVSSVPPKLDLRPDERWNSEARKIHPQTQWIPTESKQLPVKTWNKRVLHARTFLRLCAPGIPLIFVGKSLDSNLPRLFVFWKPRTSLRFPSIAAKSDYLEWPSSTWIKHFYLQVLHVKTSKPGPFGPILHILMPRKWGHSPTLRPWWFQLRSPLPEMAMT